MIARRALPFCLVLLTAVAVTAAAPAQTARVAAKRITAQGVGGVKLGRKHAVLKTKGLVGKLRPGCELAENTRSARLKAPLKGSVDLSTNAARRVTAISILGGATARGVGIGDSKADIKAAYPKVKFDSSTEEVFQITLAKVPKSGGGRLQFAVDVDTKKVTLIGVPFIAFCE